MNDELHYLELKPTKPWKGALKIGGLCALVSILASLGENDLDITSKIKIISGVTFLGSFVGYYWTIAHNKMWGPIYRLNNNKNNS